jgi:hypothetical protein
MKRVLILVEGQTEEVFVKQVLAPHLLMHDVAITPTIVTTKRVVSGPHHKGGGDFSKFEGNLKRLFGDSNAVAITTLYDYYAFPSNFPDGFPFSKPPPLGLGYSGATQIEVALSAYFQEPRFRPYLHMHEFEGFLFVDPIITAKSLFDDSLGAKLVAERGNAGSAEEINDGIETAPSRRITRLAPSYGKVLHGPAITAAVGLPKLRADCPKFSGWVNSLENL